MPTTTPNMGLSTPAVGDSDYPTSISNSFTEIDTHDHSTGNGVQIVTGGITDLAVTSAKLAANSVITAKILDANVTKAKLAALGQQISSSSGVFTSTSTSPVDVTNLSVNITTTGRPVWVGMISDGTANASYIESNNNGGNDNNLIVSVSIVRDSTEIARYTLTWGQTTNETNMQLAIPSSSVWTIDPVSAGSYTYKIQVFIVQASSSVEVGRAKLVAYEIG